MRVSLRASGGAYVKPDNGGGAGVHVDGDVAGPWETLTEIAHPNGTVVYTTYQRTLLKDHPDRNRVRADGICLDDPACQFRLIDLGGGKVALKTVGTERYLSAIGGGGGHIESDRTWIRTWEEFTRY